MSSFQQCCSITAKDILASLATQDGDISRSKIAACKSCSSIVPNPSFVKIRTGDRNFSEGCDWKAREQRSPSIVGIKTRLHNEQLIRGSSEALMETGSDDTVPLPVWRKKSKTDRARMDADCNSRRKSCSRRNGKETTTDIYQANAKAAWRCETLKHGR